LFEPSELGTTIDEMSFQHLRKDTKSYMTTVEWSAQQLEGEVLYTGELTPCPGVLEATQGLTFQPTLLEYTVLPFTLWRGSLKLMVQIIGSKVHTGRLAICTHYGRTSDSIPFSQAMAQYAHIFNFSAEENTFEVEFPWRAQQQMLRVPSGAYPDLTDFSMGEFSIRVLNPLQTMESVAQSVSLNLYWSAGDDFETDFLGANSIDLSPVVFDDN
jgi:hypothetical protein